MISFDKQLEIWESLSKHFNLIPLDGKKPINPEWTKYSHTKKVFNRNEFTKGNNAGVVCGPSSNIIVLDIDAPNLFNLLCHENNLALPNTYKVKTKNGEHHYYRYPNDGKDYRNKSLNHPLIKKLTIFDVRGKGGQVVAPGSIHEKGIVYEGIGSLENIADCPDWLIQESYNFNWSNMLTETVSNEHLNEFISSLKKCPNEIIDRIQSGATKGDRSNEICKVLLSVLKHYTE